MATIAIDTHKVITLLQDRGFTKDQAEALVAVAQEVDVSALATKLDLQVLKTDFEKALHRQTWALVGVMFAQGAFIVAMLQLLR